MEGEKRRGTRRGQRRDEAAAAETAAVPALAARRARAAARPARPPPLGTATWCRSSAGPGGRRCSAAASANPVGLVADPALLLPQPQGLSWVDDLPQAGQLQVRIYSCTSNFNSFSLPFLSLTFTPLPAILAEPELSL